MFFIGSRRFPTGFLVPRRKRTKFNRPIGPEKNAQHHVQRLVRRRALGRGAADGKGAGPARPRLWQRRPRLLHRRRRLLLPRGRSQRAHLDTFGDSELDSRISILRRDLGRHRPPSFNGAKFSMDCRPSNHPTPHPLPKTSPPALFYVHGTLLTRSLLGRARGGIFFFPRRRVRTMRTTG